MKPDCGPYQNLTAIYEIIPEIVDTAPSGLQSFLYFLAAPGFLVPFVLVLLIVIYYLDGLARKRKSINEELDRDLFAERADKKYLLRFFNIKL